MMYQPQNRKRFLDLAERLRTTDSQKYKTIIENLVNFEYDDFLNEQFATPKMQMIADLDAVGLHDEVIKVKEGYYDQ